jgi:hypothetical protein
MYIIMSDLKFTRDSVIIVCFFSTLTKAYCIVGNGGWSNWNNNSVINSSLEDHKIGTPALVLREEMILHILIVYI